MAWKNGKRALKIFFIIIVCGRRSDSKDIEGKRIFHIIALAIVNLQHITNHFVGTLSSISVHNTSVFDKRNYTK